MSVWLRLMLLLILTVNCAPKARAALVVPAEVSPGKVFVAATATCLDAAIELRWSYASQAFEAGMFAGVKVYRLKDGDEMRYRVDPLALVEDVGSKDRIRISGLTNGSRYIFVLRAYDQGGKDVEQILVFGFPGSKSRDVPPKVENLYTAAGPYAISIFWDRLDEVNIGGYEILRRRKDEQQFSVLGHVERVIYVDGRRAGAVVSGELPEVNPTMYRDRTALPGIAYVYQVRGVDTEGKTGPGVDTLPVALCDDRSPLPEEILILAIWNSADSKGIAREYASRRGIPETNIMPVTLFTGSKYRNRQIVEEVRDFLLDKGLAGKIRVFVPTYGIPLGDGQRSLDSMLIDPFNRFEFGRVMGTPNPVFNHNMHHDPTHGMYLVSRLDGPTPEIAMALVSKAIKAEQHVNARSGFAFFSNPNFRKECEVAAKRHGVNFISEDKSYTKDNFIPSDTTWFFGSGHSYRHIRREPWPVGAIAGFLKSDTLTAIRDKKTRFWTQGFLEEGVTATYGSAIEPYLQGYTRGDILFDRFWSGRYSFAEAFFMATPTFRWAMCAIGDPMYKLRSD